MLPEDESNSAHHPSTLIVPQANRPNGSEHFVEFDFNKLTGDDQRVDRAAHLTIASGDCVIIGRVEGLKGPEGEAVQKA
jgi:hypothetical protein